MINKGYSRETFVGNNANTVFVFDFDTILTIRGWSNADGQIKVVKKDKNLRLTLLTVNIDYGIDFENKRVTFPLSTGGKRLQADEQLIICRQLPYAQLLDLSLLGQYDKEDVEKAFDYTTCLIQQAKDGVDYLVAEAFDLPYIALDMKKMADRMDALGGLIEATNARIDATNIEIERVDGRVDQTNERIARDEILINNNTQRFNTVYTKTEVDNLFSDFSKFVEHFVGYFAPQPPTENILKGQLWVEYSQEGKPPETFPFTNVKKWDGTAWIDADDYTPTSMEMWSNLNLEEGEGAGWVWFGNDWYRNDTPASLENRLDELESWEADAKDEMGEIQDNIDEIEDIIDRIDGDIEDLDEKINEVSANLTELDGRKPNKSDLNFEVVREIGSNLTGTSFKITQTLKNISTGATRAGDYVEIPLASDNYVGLLSREDYANIKGATGNYQAQIFNISTEHPYTQGFDTYEMMINSTLFMADNTYTIVRDDETRGDHLTKYYWQPSFNNPNLLYAGEFNTTADLPTTGVFLHSFANNLATQTEWKVNSFMDDIPVWTDTGDSLNVHTHFSNWIYSHIVEFDPRNFTLNPIQSDEIATGAVEQVKLAQAIIDDIESKADDRIEVIDTISTSIVLSNVDANTDYVCGLLDTLTINSFVNSPYEAVIYWQCGAGFTAPAFPNVSDIDSLTIGVKLSKIIYEANKSYSITIKNGFIEFAFEAVSSNDKSKQVLNADDETAAEDISVDNPEALVFYEEE